MKLCLFLKSFIILCFLSSTCFAIEPSVAADGSKELKNPTENIVKNTKANASDGIQTEQSKEEQKIEEAFNQFKKLSLAKDGGALSKVFPDTSIERYKEIQRQAMQLDIEKLLELPVIQYMHIVWLRMAFNPKELANLSLDKQTSTMLKMHLLAGPIDDQSEASKIEIIGNKAIVTDMFWDQKVAEYVFLKEKGEWKFDAVDEMSQMEHQMDAYMKPNQEKMTANAVNPHDMAAGLLEMKSGIKLDPTLHFKPYKDLL